MRKTIKETLSSGNVIIHKNFKEAEQSTQLSKYRMVKLAKSGLAAENGSTFAVVEAPPVTQVSKQSIAVRVANHHVAFIRAQLRDAGSSERFVGSVLSGIISDIVNTYIAQQAAAQEFKDAA